VLPRRRANKSQPTVLRRFSHWPRRIGAVGRGGAAGSKWSSARPEARGRGRCRKLKTEGKEREGKSCWKSGGGRVRLYTWHRAGLADAVGCDAIPDAAGGEAVTGSLNRKGQSTGRPLT
jgi:hypothetical protein